MAKRKTGQKRKAQKDGGPARPKSHSGKRLSKAEWLAKLAEVQQELDDCKQKLAACKRTPKVKVEKDPCLPDSKQEGAASSADQEIQRLRSEIASLLSARQERDEEVKQLRNRHAEELASVRNQLEVRIAALVSTNQELHLDVEWLTGLRSQDVPPSSCLRRRMQRCS